MTTKTEWDKTNIGENYPGTTLPLTYSFIREAYKNVYASFLRLLGYKQTYIDDKATTLNNMLGYINGEVFYNINNWYEFIKLLPGYKYNKKFFENMLNPVKTKPDEAGRDEVLKSIKELPKLMSLILNIVFVKRHYNSFAAKYSLLYKYFESLNLKELDNKSLVKELTYLESKFFELWGYTIINDFRVMIFFGMYSKVLRKTANNNEQQISKHLSGITSKPESIAVTQEIRAIARAIKKRKLSLTTYADLKKNHSEIYSMVDNYLQKYGERSYNELKLEQTNFIEQPDQFIKLLSYYIQLPEEMLVDNKDTADKTAEESLSLSPTGILYWVLKKETIQSIHKREEYRIKRAKVFRIANEFFKEMGNRMVKENLINHPNDIYYLYKQEITDTLNNHRLVENFSNTVLGRKNSIKEYDNQMLPRRVVTEGISHIEKGEKAVTPTPLNQLRGKTTSPGYISKGAVVKMPSLDFDTDVRGKILVTQATDPGWTVLFPMLKGIIIETGGLLSHASIVARELGIPCIVLPDALKKLENGDLVKIDGDTGQVTIIRHENTD